MFKNIIDKEWKNARNSLITDIINAIANNTFKNKNMKHVTLIEHEITGSGKAS